MNHQDTPKSISIPLIISIIAISFAAIFVKWSDAPSSILSMYRMVFATVFIIPIAWKKRATFKQISKKGWFFLVFSGLFLAMHFALWFESLKLTTVASSTVILALQPVVALIGGFILYKERTSKSALVTMGIAIIGVMMIGWGDIGLGKEAIIGDILSFLCVIAVVCYLLIGQNVVRKLSHWIYSFCVFMFAAIFLAMYNLVLQIDFVGYEKQEWGIFLLLAIFPTIAHVIFNWLLNYVNSTTISMSVLGEPVGATLLAVLLLGERLVGWQIIGGIFVLTGVFLFLIQQKNRIAYKDATEKS
jgi:drug/metabolite transporter (DMT)-like permease